MFLISCYSVYCRKLTDIVNLNESSVQLSDFEFETMIFWNFKNMIMNVQFSDFEFETMIFWNFKNMIMNVQFSDFIAINISSYKNDFETCKFWCIIVQCVIFRCKISSILDFIVLKYLYKNWVIYVKCHWFLN